MSEYISPTKFIDAEGTEDWRLTSEGACAFFRTASFVQGAQFVEAIGRLPIVLEHTLGRYQE